MTEETPEENKTPMTYAELCMVYGDPHKKTRAPKNKINKNEFYSAVIALCGIILLFSATVLFYSRTVVKMGGTAIYGKTQNIFTFIRGQYNAIIEQGKGIAEASAEDILGIFGIAQAAVAFGYSIIVLIAQTVVLIKAVISFTKRKTADLPVQLVSALLWVASIYAVFNYVCNVSGGEGISYYYMGDLPSPWLTAAAFIAAAASAACILLQGINAKGFIKENGLQVKTLTAYADYIAGFALAAVFCILPLSRVVGYILTGSLSSVVSALLTNSFSVMSFLFALLNLLLIIFTLVMFKKAATMLKKKTKELFNPSSQLLTAEYIINKKGKKVKNKGAYPVFAALSALCLAFIMILHIPKVGLGWSVNILPYYAAIFIIVLVWCIAVLLIPRLFNVLRRKPAVQTGDA